jgi:hypothetical protein
VQTSNPFPVPFPYCLSEALARSYLRAQEAHPGTAPGARDIFAAFAESRGAPANAAAPPEAEASGADPAAVCGLLDMAELLAVMREPIAWVFTLAERRAQGDAVDLAAIVRVRDAILHRVDAFIAGAVPSEPPRIRTADLLTVASLLVGTLDSAIVRQAVHALGGGLIDALGVLWPLIPASADDAAGTRDACCGSCAHDQTAAHACCDHVAPRVTPFANPFVAPFASPFAAPFGAPHMPRSPVSPWFWPLVGFPF